MKAQTRALYLALWAITLALYVAWPLTHLNAYAWSNDEGLYMQRAALANAGYALYRDIAFNKPPLLIWLLQLAFKVAGPRIATARVLVLGLTLIGILALGILTAKLWENAWAGLAAAMLLLALPEMPVRVAAVMSDLPALSAGMIGLTALLTFRQTHQRRWLVFSALGCASALLIHPMLIYIGLPIAVLLFYPRLIVSQQHNQQVKNNHAAIREIILFTAVGLSLGLLILACIDRQAFFTWGVRRNLAAVDANLQEAATTINRDQLFTYLTQHWPHVWLTLASAAVWLTHPHIRRRLILPALWLLGILAIALTWSPFWDHYLIYLMYPAAIIAGGGVVTALEWLRDIIKPRETSARGRAHSTLSGRGVQGDTDSTLSATSARGRADSTLSSRGVQKHADSTLSATSARGRADSALLVLVLISVVTLCLWRARATMPQPEGGPTWSSSQLEARAYIETHVPPDSFVAGDDPLLIFATGRLVPPAMVEATFRQIRMGYYDTADLISDILQFRTPIALYATGRLSMLSSAKQWIADQAMERRDFGSLRAYRLDLPTPLAVREPLAQLGPAILLQGYDLSSIGLAPGTTLTVTLWWEAQATLEADYTVFVHLLDTQGNLVTQHDGPSLSGAYPTSVWQTGFLIPDEHILTLPPDLPLGTYTLHAGMYQLPSLERLPAIHSDTSRWLNDSVQLTTLTITEFEQGTKQQP